MKKKSLKRLSLHRETLRTLEGSEVVLAQGNFASAVISCDVPCKTNEASACYYTCQCIPR